MGPYSRSQIMATAAMVAAAMALPGVDTAAPRIIPRKPRLVQRTPYTREEFRYRSRFSDHLPHQGEAEKARRRRQMERAARKQESKR